MSKINYAKIICESIVKKEPLKVSILDSELIDYAIKNKVLYLLGFYDERIRNLQIWRDLDTRYREQLKTIIELMDVSRKLEINIIIVKTLKPFPYAPDDIDVLVINNKHLRKLVNYLMNRGYFILKKGTPEITIRKIIGRISIDLDIHTKMGAGPYEYIDKYYLWRRRSCKRIDSTCVITPNPVDEFLIAAAHAVMKELSINIADTVHVLSLDRNLLASIRKQAETIGLLNAVESFIYLSIASIFRILVGDNKWKIRIDDFPIKVPWYMIMKSYLENISYRLRVQYTNPLRELFKIPSSRGISVILRYLGL